MNDLREITATLEKFKQLFDLLRPAQRAPLPTQQPLEYKWVRKGEEALRARTNREETQTMNQPYKLTEENLRLAFEDAAKLSGDTPATAEELAAIKERMPRNIILAEGTMQEMAETLALVGHKSGAASRYFNDDRVYDAAAILSVAQRSGYDVAEVTRGAKVQVPHSDRVETLPIGRADEARRFAEIRAQVEAALPTIRAPRLEPRQATDLEQAQAIASELETPLPAPDLKGLPIPTRYPDQTPRDRRDELHKDAAAVFCRAADTIDTAAMHIEGAKGSYQERGDYAANVVLQRPEVKEAMDVALTLAPYVDDHDLAGHLSRTDPEHGAQRLEAAKSVRDSFSGDHETRAQDMRGRLLVLHDRVTEARETLKSKFGVREPANAVDVKRAGKEAQDFAAFELYPAEAALELTAAAASPAQIAKDNRQTLHQALGYVAEDSLTTSTAETFAQMAKANTDAQSIAGQAAEKTYTREQLKALADKCNPVDFAPTAYDPNDLGSMEHEHEMLHTYGMSADEVHEHEGKQELAALVEAAERNQTTNKQAQNIAAQRGRGHGFSR